MVRALAVSIIVAIVVSFTAVSNAAAQPMGYNQYEGRPDATSWEMYRQQQIEMQLEMQRRQLEMQQQQVEIQRQQHQLEIQRQQLEMQRQQLEIQRQQQQMELEKQMIEREKK